MLFKSANSALISYTFSTAVYAGKPVAEPTEYHFKGVTSIGKVLIDRLGRVVDLKERNITLEGLYTTYVLMTWLMSKSITTVGTLMSDRKRVCSTRRARFSIIQFTNCYLISTLQVLLHCTLML